MYTTPWRSYEFNKEAHAIGTLMRQREPKRDGSWARTFILPYAEQFSFPLNALPYYNIEYIAPASISSLRG
jgi:hypothetical protein